MKQIAAALQNPGSLAALLDAASDAFELIISASGTYADTDEGFFTALVFVLAAAAEGRDAIITAPSLPTRPPKAGPAGDLGPHPTVPEVAAALASLSSLLFAQLTSAAGLARQPEDQIACRVGAQYAGEIHALLAGTQP
jgi:hypothetical protein